MEDGEEKENSNTEEFVKNAIWETLHENKQLSAALGILDDNSNLSNASSSSSLGGLEIDITHEPSTSKLKSKKRKVMEPMPKELENMEEEIEEQLGTKAKKSKLTVTNVKNILRHVITNQHVMAMVKQSMRESGDADSSDEDFPYEPKLTRAKTKELQNKFAWPVTPTKAPPASETKKLIDEELPEDEEADDEEYQPHEDEYLSDDEGSSMASDLEPLTPQPMTPRSTDCSTQTTWTDDGLFRLPRLERTGEVESLESIGQRTRSKLCLSDTALETIEQSFVPPDITTDMYDLECDNEDWREFLEDFTQPLNSVVNDTIDDDEADPEYNILEDEEAEDKEELRADRAVKVSKKELNELISELMEFLEPSDDEADATCGDNSLQTPNSSPLRPLVDNTFSGLQAQRELQQQAQYGMYIFPHSMSSPLQPQTPPPALHSSVVLPSSSPVLPVVLPAGSPGLPMSLPTILQTPTRVLQTPVKTMQTPATPLRVFATPVRTAATPAPSPVTPVQQGVDEGRFILPDRVVVAREASLQSVLTVSHHQRALLAQQMRQHVQLMAQSYMQSTTIPEMACCATETKENLLSLKFLKGLDPNSAFYASNLEDAIQVVNEWDDILREDNPKSKELKRFTEEEKERKVEARRRKRLFHPRLCPLFLDLVSKSKAFIYPLLLPHCSFSSRCNVPRALNFTVSENNLLVFGLEQFLPYIEKTIELHSKKKTVTMKKVSELISEFLLAPKTSLAIETHIAFLKRSSNNVVSQFFNENKVPPTVHFVIDVQVKAPCEQPKELLPVLWRKHVYQE